MVLNRKKRFNPFNVEIGKIHESAEAMAFWAALNTRKLPAQKNPKTDLKKKYTKALELSFSAALVLTLGFFYMVRSTQIQGKTFFQTIAKLEVEQIPPTQQFRKPPPPARPAIPIPTESEDIPDEETIALTNLDLSDIPPPPSPSDLLDESSDIFVAYDIPPRPVGGWKSIYKYLVYPEIAVKAGVEGRVILRVLVDERGNVEATEIAKSSGSKVGLEEAAIKAVRSVKWRPAMQRDLPVKVWIHVPIRFDLKDA